MDKFEELVSNHYNVLNESDKIILEFFYENMKSIPYMGIEAVATECAVSRSTVMRFAQKLGLKGYMELKTLIKWEMSIQKVANMNIVDLVCDTNINVINNFRNLNCDDICSSFFYARRIFVYGTGNIQRSACNEFKRIFLSVGIIVENIAGEAELTKTMKLISTKDVIFIISQSGNSDLMIRVCKYLNTKGVKIISLTFSNNNFLANHSDYRLFLQSEEIVVRNNSAIKSVTIVFPIIEILCAKFIAYLLSLEKELEAVPIDN